LSINGALNLPMMIAKAAAPFGAAWLWAASGSYAAVLIAMLVGSTVLVLTFWLSAVLAGRRAL
jgi:hypothetical protein